MTLPIQSSLTYSPLWYSTNALDTFEWSHDDKSGIFYYGARNSIYFIKVNEIGDNSKIINDKSNKNFYYEAKICFFMKAHHDLIVGVYTLPNEILMTFGNEKKLAKLISCGKDKMIRVWSFDEKFGCTCLKELNINNTNLTTNVTCISVSNRNIAVCGFEKGFLLSWNFVTDSEWKAFLTESDDIVQLVWNEDKLAIGHKRGFISVYSMLKFDTLTKLTRFRAHHSDTCNISWNPFPETVDMWGDLATSGKDCRISLWRIDTNVNIGSLKLPKARKFVSDTGSTNKDTVSSWSSLCWSSIDKGTLIVSNAFGNLGTWKCPSATEIKCFQQNSQMKIHTNSVFGISEWRNYRGLFVSHSLDRTINISKLTENGTSEGCLYSLPGLGGFVMSLSGVEHTNQLAIGCGDKNIRLWKYDSFQRRSHDITNIWNGINGKVMSVCWHPFIEGLLAFGTEDGQVGLVNVNKDKKIATSSKKHHEGKVFVVTWAVDLRRTDNVFDGSTGEESLIVYSVGNFCLIGHDFRRDDYFDASKIVCEVGVGISDFCVHSSLRFVAVGYGNGVVKVYSTSPVNLVCSIKSHSKGINCMRWGPLESVDKLAIGSNERFLTVTDLKTIFRDFNQCETGKWISLDIVETVAQLKGHGNRITCVDWSPFDEDKIVTTSYDGTAFVWSVSRAEPVACFEGHQGNLLCCQWCRRDPDLIYTGGDDSNLFGWRLSEQNLHTKLNKRRQIKEIPGISFVKPKTADVTHEEMNKEKETVTTVEGDTEENVVEEKSAGKTVTKKPFVKKRSSLFPSTFFNVHHLQEEYHWSMIKIVSDQSDYLPCLAMFQNRATILSLINDELNYHCQEGNYDNYFIILLWIGKVGAVLREIVTKNFSPDWLMAVVFSFAANSVPDSLIQTMIGNIIVDRKDPVLAATCLLSTGDSVAAVELLISHQCYREALILAKLRLAPDHPLIGTAILPQLQTSFFRNGSFELAAMCSLSLGNYRCVVDTLKRRNTLLSEWVIIKIMISVCEHDLVHQCVGNFVNGLLLMQGSDESMIEASQWLDLVRAENCLSHYSVLIDLYSGLWIKHNDLTTIVTSLRNGCLKYGVDRMRSLQTQVRSRVAARQLSHVTSQVSVHVTYELFIVVVDRLLDDDSVHGDDEATFESLREGLRQLRVLNNKDELLERLMVSVPCGDGVVESLREKLASLEI